MFVISNAKFSWWLATNDISQDIVLELTVFSVFLKDLDDGTEGQSTLSASSQKIPVQEKQLIRSKVVLILRETLMGLRDLMRFSKCKYKVLHLGWHKHMEQYRLGIN